MARSRTDLAILIGSDLSRLDLARSSSNPTTMWSHPIQAQPPMAGSRSDMDHRRRIWPLETGSSLFLIDSDHKMVETRSLSSDPADLDHYLLNLTLRWLE